VKVAFLARRLVGVGAAAVITAAAAPMLVGTASAAVTSVAPLVGVAATPSGKGYWEVASDGGVFAFGDAQFFGSMGGKSLNAPVVGVAATPSGKGYWEVASDGGVFAFGDAPFKGSKGGQPLKDPVSGITGTPSGQGYLLTAADGGVFAYGDAAFKGSMGTRPLAASVNSIVRTPSGGGYWLSAVDGGVFAFGDASYLGRATYNPPAVPSGGTAAQRAAGLAHGWVGLDYQGVNKDYWNAPKHPELWCADFLTYTWQHAGINIPHYSAVSSLQSWAQKNGRWSTDIAHPHVGDAVVYGGSHTDIVVQVAANGTVVSVDGDWGGQGSDDAAFATTARVKLNTWQSLARGLGAGGMRITGYVRAS